MLAQRRRPKITSALGQCIVLSGVSDAGMLKRHQHNGAVRKNNAITQCCFNDGPALKTVVLERTHVEDIFEVVSLSLSLIISWTFRILAHEEEQYTDFLSIALKQTKAGLRSSRTSFLLYVSNLNVLI